ncbi:MAG: hypothetical protein ACI9LV_000379 [Candidatus Nanohaloarchaea archaeon]|jgi:hypothetical protein
MSVHLENTLAQTFLREWPKITGSIKAIYAVFRFNGSED